MLVSWVLSGLIAYWLGTVAGRPLAVRLAGEDRVARAEQLIDRSGAPALLLSRLVPFVPFSLVGYLAGAARVPVWRYTWTTFVGVMPITAAATYLGHALDDLSASDPLLWVAIAVMVVLTVLTVSSARRLRRSAGSSARAPRPAGSARHGRRPRTRARGGRCRSWPAARRA